MTAPVNPVVDEQRGRRLGTWSLLMLPAVLISLLLANVIGYGLLQLMGMADNESFYDKGVGGWLIALLLTAVIAAPQVVGVLLGVKARRLGAGSLAVLAIALNAVLLAFWVATFLANAVLA